MQAYSTSPSIRIVHADAHEPVEDGIAVLEFDVELLVAAGVPVRSAPDFQPRGFQARIASARHASFVGRISVSVIRHQRVTADYGA